jgi:hypothetical protein
LAPKEEPVVQSPAAEHPSSDASAPTGPIDLVRAFRIAERAPDEPVRNIFLIQKIAQPRKIRFPRGAYVTAPRGCRTKAGVVLPIAVPAFVRDEYVVAETESREERLVIVHAAE